MIAEHEACYRLLLSNNIGESIVSTDEHSTTDNSSLTELKTLVDGTHVIKIGAESMSNMIEQQENISTSTPTINDLELQLLEASKSGDLDVVKVEKRSMLRIGLK